MKAKLTPGQTLAVLLAASTDPKLSAVQRAAAREAAEAVDEKKAPTVPGLLLGPFLTGAGREAVLSLLPEPGPHLFPRVLDDLLRRLRGAGRPCADVRLDPEEGEHVWTLRWTGEGFADFALVGQGRRPEALGARCELASAAVALGLEVAGDGPTWARFAPPAPVAETEDGKEDTEDEEDDDLGELTLRPWRSPFLIASRAEAEAFPEAPTTMDRILAHPDVPRRRVDVTLEEIIAGLEGVAYVPAPTDSPLRAVLGCPADAAAPVSLFA